MPWQQQVLDVALEIDEHGRFAYRQVILTVPRQSGKTTLLLVLVLLRAISESGQNIRYTAQTGSDARKKFVDDWLTGLKTSKFGGLFKPRLTNGHEALLFNNGSHFGLVATTHKSGHGGTIDLGILDEAFAHPDARLEQALGPAMITRPKPQLWVVSTAGTYDGSPYLWDKVEKGRQIADAGLNSQVAYFEWSADENADPADPATWWRCMPALGRTATEDAVRAEFESMDLSEFKRAYLNQWVVQSNDPIIPLALWHGLEDNASQIANERVLSFDISPDRSSAAIGVAGKRSDGLWHVEVIDQQPGTNWIIPKLLDLNERHKPSSVIYDPGSPAGSLKSDLEATDLPIVEIGGKEQAEACGRFYDAVMEKTLRHMEDAGLVSALDGACKRNIGDAWGWNRRGSSVDISPLVSVTIALFGAQTQTSAGEVGIWSLDEVVKELQERKRKAEGNA